MEVPCSSGNYYAPVFWTDDKPAVDYDVFTINCADLDLSDPVVRDEVECRMKETFNKVGLVHVINTGLKKLNDLRSVASCVVQNTMEYKGGANSRDGIVDNVYETGAPKEAHLHYHHEMAYVSKSTSMLGFLCESHVSGKGWTFVSDQIGLTKHILQTELGKKLKEKGLCYIRCLTDRDAYRDKDESTVYNHWQKSFGVESPEEVEILAKERGLVCQWGEDPTGAGGRYLITRFYVSAFEYCPATDSNIMYASVADDAMWFDGWPGVKNMPNSHRPLKLTYGDDSEFTKEEFRQWVDIYDKFGVPIRWKTGDIAIVCNWRWAHGRPPYSLENKERRQLGVMLGATFDRIEAKDDKWPTTS